MRVVIGLSGSNMHRRRGCAPVAASAGHKAPVK